MAGKYVKIVRPGYSMLWTENRAYTPGSGDVSTLNPFDPSSARPLIEGEWLQMVGDEYFTRGGNNVVSVSGTPDGEGTAPAFLLFQEKGRYDSQVVQQAHCVTGPLGFEIETKLCKSAGLSVNDKVSVWDLDSLGDGKVYRVLAAFSAGWAVGRVSRIIGTNHIRVVVGLS